MVSRLKTHTLLVKPPKVQRTCRTTPVSQIHEVVGASAKRTPKVKRNSNNNHSNRNNSNSNNNSSNHNSNNSNNLLEFKPSSCFVSASFRVKSSARTRQGGRWWILALRVYGLLGFRV